MKRGFCVNVDELLTKDHIQFYKLSNLCGMSQWLKLAIYPTPTAEKIFNQVKYPILRQIIYF